MNKFEQIFGYLGQITWRLALKSLLYAILFALAIFLSVFLPALPTDPFLITKEILLSSSKLGVAAIYQFVLVLAMPFIVSFIRTDKK